MKKVAVKTQAARNEKRQGFRCCPSPAKGPQINFSPRPLQGAGHEATFVSILAVFGQVA